MGLSRRIRQLVFRLSKRKHVVQKREYHNVEFTRLWTSTLILTKNKETLLARERERKLLEIRL